MLPVCALPFAIIKPVSCDNGTSVYKNYVCVSREYEYAADGTLAEASGTPTSPVAGEYQVAPSSESAFAVLTILNMVFSASVSMTLWSIVLLAPSDRDISVTSAFVEFSVSGADLSATVEEFSVTRAFVDSDGAPSGGKSEMRVRHAADDQRGARLRKRYRIYVVVAQRRQLVLNIVVC